MSARYAATFSPTAARAQDQAYAQAMKAVWQRYPDDADIATLYAEASFLLLPRPGALDIKSPAVIEVLRVLEGVLARDVRHPGACHLYVHTTEWTPEPARGEKCVEFLGTARPGASHINHMPSHTWSKVGRWGDAVRASLQAWQSDQKAVAGGDAFITYPAHDLQMLVFAASMDGQGSVAIQAGTGLARLTRDPMYRGLALVRFGRFADIPAIGERPSGDLASGMWDFAQGYAQLRKGDATAARASLDRLTATAGTTKAVFKIHPVGVLLRIVSGILDGEIRRAAGDIPGAVAAFQQAVAAEDTLLVDEPEPLPFAARHWLGAALLQAKRFAEAEQVYQADLADHPKNGWSLRGLQQALEGQGKPSAAVADQFRASWVRSDTPITASRF